jgi:hypothetical protein
MQEKYNPARSLFLGSGEDLDPGNSSMLEEMITGAALSIQPTKPLI